jgi:SAM-dependent methyltransferase
VSAARARGRRGSVVHEGLVGARKLVGTPYLASPTLRDEYARDIAPRTEAALARILGEVYGAPDARGVELAGNVVGQGTDGAGPRLVRPTASFRTMSPPTRAIDLGAGTGAVGRALRARFGESLRVVAVDLVSGPGILHADLASELPAVDGRFDLVVAAHLLNELFVDRAPVERVELRARRVLDWSRALLATGGAMVLVEPALRGTSRELLAMRDQLLAAGLKVVAPCFWTGPCPALARERDWCHDAAPIANGARVDYSYLVLRAADLRAAPTVPDPTLFRIVSDPMVEKGRLRLFGCGLGGRHPLVRLDRHASISNAPFDALHRGSTTRISPTQLLGDGLRLSPDTTVISLDPPERA